MGAAIQGSVLASDDRDLLLLDVTPFSLGIATFDGHFAKLIERNTTVAGPEVAHLHHHARQPDRGEDPGAPGRARDARPRTTCSASSCSRTSGTRPKGAPEIEVAFDIDANGIVSVSARDLATGKEQSITVNATGTLSDEEIERIMQDNAQHELPREK